MAVGREARCRLLAPFGGHAFDEARAWWSKPSKPWNTVPAVLCLFPKIPPPTRQPPRHPQRRQADPNPVGVQRGMFASGKTPLLG